MREQRREENEEKGMDGLSQTQKQPENELG
jgi:hypothetical protein